MLKSGHYLLKVYQKEDKMPDKREMIYHKAIKAIRESMTNEEFFEFFEEYDGDGYNYFWELLMEEAYKANPKGFNNIEDEFMKEEAPLDG